MQLVSIGQYWVRVKTEYKTTADDHTYMCTEFPKGGLGQYMIMLIAGP